MSLLHAFLGWQTYASADFNARLVKESYFTSTSKGRKRTLPGIQAGVYVGVPL